MTLYPQARAAIGAQEKVVLTLDRLGEARQSMVDALDTEVLQGPPLKAVRNVDAEGVPARLYLPDSRTSPIVVYLHGGGWVLGGLDTHDGLCRLLADRSSCAVLAVDYRLASEHPYPAAFEDLERAVGWLRRGGAAEHGLDANRLAIAGDSAGGHLAAVGARRARDRRGALPRPQPQLPPQVGAVRRRAARCGAPGRCGPAGAAALSPPDKPGRPNGPATRQRTRAPEPQPGGLSGTTHGGPPGSSEYASKRAAAATLMRAPPADAIQVTICAGSDVPSPSPSK